MEEKRIICPQCQHNFPLGNYPAGGMWECPQCSHNFRAAMSDLETPLAVVEEKKAEEKRKDRYPLFSLLSMAFFVLSLLGTFTWIVPGMVCQEGLASANNAPCCLKMIMAWGDAVVDYSCQVWTFSILGGFFAWLLAIRFLKGFARCLFHGMMLMIYLALIGSVAAAVWMSYVPCGIGCFK